MGGLLRLSQKEAVELLEKSLFDKFLEESLAKKEFSDTHLCKNVDKINDKIEATIKKGERSFIFEFDNGGGVYDTISALNFLEVFYLSQGYKVKRGGEIRKNALLIKII